MSNRRYRILIIHDIEIESYRGVHRWAYATRSYALQKYAPKDFIVDRCNNHDVSWHEIYKYDLIFLLDYMFTQFVRRQIESRRGDVRTLLVTSFNKDTRSRHMEWDTTRAASSWVIANNKQRFEGCRRLPKTCNISNPIDTAFWKPRPRAPLADDDVILWCGGVGPKKMKGWFSLIEPLMETMRAEGFSCSFRPITEITPKQVYTPVEQRRWYHRGTYVLCASKTEGGGPNFVMEAMACGCIPVTTWVGGVPEYCRNQDNAIRITPTRESIMEGLLEARENKQVLRRNAIKSMRAWSYGPPANRTDYFYALFRKLIDRKKVVPFSCSELKPEDI